LEPELGEFLEFAAGEFRQIDLERSRIIGVLDRFPEGELDARVFGGRLVQPRAGERREGALGILAQIFAV